MATASNRRKSSREIKRERIELRVGASAKELIQRAMAVTGLTAGDRAYEGARRVLDEHERMVLTGADREAFFEALMIPPEPSEKLIAALRRHRDGSVALPSLVRAGIGLRPRRCVPSVRGADH
jgi:uncharacterized protein (DUF1778 family)